MSLERRRLRFELKRAYVELAAPVEGELRRERVADVDVPCPRCGAREWLLIERRAEPEEPFTRWRALACANCGAGDGWQSAGRTRPGRAAERWGDWVEEAIPDMPDEPTAGDVCRLAPFRVFSAGESAELRKYSHSAGRLTGVTLATGMIEVTTEIRPRTLYSLPADVEPPPERRARGRLAQLVHDRDTALREPRSESAYALHIAAAWRQAESSAAGAQAREATIDVDDAPVRFMLVEHEGWWAAVADVGDESITIATRDVPATEVELHTVSDD